MRLLRDALRAQPGLHRAALCGAAVHGTWRLPPLTLCKPPRMACCCAGYAMINLSSGAQARVLGLYPATHPGLWTLAYTRPLCLLLCLRACSTHRASIEGLCCSALLRWQHMHPQA